MSEHQKVKDLGEYKKKKKFKNVYYKRKGSSGHFKRISKKFMPNIAEAIVAILFTSVSASAIKFNVTIGLVVAFLLFIIYRKVEFKNFSSNSNSPDDLQPKRRNI